MASLRRIISVKTITSGLQNSRIAIENKGNLLKNHNSLKRTKLVFLGTASFGVLYFAKSFINNQKLLSFSFPWVVQAKDNSEVKIHSPHTRREARFQQFASLEYEGNIYMTPQDFLESVTEESPRPRIGRIKLTRAELDSILKQTPSLSRGSDKLFRKLHDKGIISYTEYLFLLCVLTMSHSTAPPLVQGTQAGKSEPHSGFRIAFNMFDTDGNQMVDKNEFMVLEKVFSTASKASPAEKTGASPISDGNKSQNLKHEIVDTTLLFHFFGKKGKDVLKYKDFHRFMENLQDEIIQLEFFEFSKGLRTISEVEFARVLLRYTNLDKGEIETCIERLTQKFTNEKGISYDEFHRFFQFLNNLDDFAIAMKMYTYSMKSISQEEFQRAVKVCTGYTLGPHIVDTVFQMFDADGDGHLSHKEFISIMKDRLHRGARSHLMQNQNSWDAFKACVKQEMRSI